VAPTAIRTPISRVRSVTETSNDAHDADAAHEQSNACHDRKQDRHDFTLLRRSIGHISHVPHHEVIWIARSDPMAIA
jgi:hypothetical protein